VLSARNWKTAYRDERGVALIEMTVVLPVIMLIGFGVIEFAHYLFNYQLVQSGVRDAARYGASLPAAANSAEQTVQDGWIRSIAVTGQVSGGTSRLPAWSTAHVSLRRSTVANPVLSGGLRTYRAEGDVRVLTVSASVPYTSIGFLGFLGIDALTIDATQQERVSGGR